MAREAAVQSDWKSSVPKGPSAVAESQVAGEEDLNNKAPLSPHSRIKEEASARRYTIIDNEVARLPSRRFPLAPYVGCILFEVLNVDS